MESNSLDAITGAAGAKAMKSKHEIQIEIQNTCEWMAYNHAIYGPDCEDYEILSERLGTLLWVFEVSSFSRFRFGDPLPGYLKEEMNKHRNKDD